MKQQACLPALFCFLQESAWRHAEINDFGWAALSKLNCFWAVSRIKVQIDDYPEWNDEISLETWSKAPDALMAYRDFEIFNGENRRIICASSAWLILDIATRRPKRMSVLTNEYPILHGRQALSSGIGKIQRAPRDSGTDIHTVPYSAIDMNGHVNNANYVQWTLDAFPAEFIVSHNVHEIEINYLHESHIGNTYRVNIEETAPLKYLCNIVRIDDSRELVRMMLSFKKRLLNKS
jgi:acyl-ACP thioesterase